MRTSQKTIKQVAKVLKYEVFFDISACKDKITVWNNEGKVVAYFNSNRKVYEYLWNILRADKL